MDIAQSLQIHKIVPALKVRSAKDAYQYCASIAAQEFNLNGEMLFQLLWEQEMMRGSGIGNGIAIADLFVAGLTDSYNIFVKFDKPILFHGADQEVVDLLMVVLSPPSHGPLHLRSLARFNRLMRDEKICATLRGTEDPDLMHSFLTDPQSRQLAA
jgi:mannitol/fructose-specific phosphotransferase system IIA component (Ntr-type)